MFALYEGRARGDPRQSGRADRIARKERHAVTSFSKKRYREIIVDGFDPDLGIFWRDFLLAYVGFIGSCAALVLAPALWMQALAFVVGVILAYRCASYVHEVVHLPKTSFKSFIIGWNALIGIPFLMPSMLYESHLDHHIPRKYGTANDPEYLPLKGAGLGEIVSFILHHALATPLILFVRLAIGLPVRLVSKKLASLLDRKFSSLVINWDYERLTGQNKTLLMGLEAYVLGANIVGGTLISLGYLNPLILLKLVSVILVALVLNGIRTLAAHRYHNHDLQPVNAENQLLDSLNYQGPPWIGLLMAPVGLRYHALHHLFPNMPYHSLDAAHKKLMAELPEDDVYRQTVFTSFTGQLAELMEPDAKEPPAAEAA